MAELAPGAVFGEFRVEGLIAHGGMGIVYKARQERLGRLVALKVIAPHLALDEGFRERFRREAQMAAAIDHPNVLPIYAAGEIDDQPYLAMRYVEGTDLRAVIDRDAPLELGRVIDLLAQVAGALDAAHARGLIHRDVKPANILIDQGVPGREVVYLTDFGLTRGRTDTRLTQTGTWVGTVDYMAPEQFESRQADAGVDKYSLACVMYEALTGVRPFERDSDVQVMFAHIRDDPPAATQVRADLPAGVDDVMRTGMAKAPEDRFATCGALVDALRSTVSSGAPEAPAATAPAVPAVESTLTGPTPDTSEPVGAPLSGPSGTQVGPRTVVDGDSPSGGGVSPEPGGGGRKPWPTRKLVGVVGGAAALVVGVVAAAALTGGDDPTAGTTSIASTAVTTEATATTETATTDTTETTIADPDGFPPTTAEGVLAFATQPATGVVTYRVTGAGQRGTMRIAIDATRLGVLFRTGGTEVRLHTESGDTRWVCAKTRNQPLTCLNAQRLDADTRKGFEDTVGAFNKFLTNEGLQASFGPIVATGAEVYADREADREVACLEKRIGDELARLCTTQGGLVTNISVVASGQTFTFVATSLRRVTEADFLPPARLQ